ncbi:hypothetical protein FEM03_12875 [Phragmitibacter flavus]|uniref:Uncharacterized protein n=1 Tax=Phragmitibacter flavus TaxID=2576071 RepID=A0A5R8KE86_9BACT|nr:hypothetical protein [Phragmitibacter flavus]TLD70603.1 hypothetical protein FEM03_12875 [Phragmitibacter flavus]
MKSISSIKPFSKNVPWLAAAVVVLGLGTSDVVGQQYQNQPQYEEPGVGRRVSNFFKGLVGRDEPEPPQYYRPPPSQYQRQRPVQPRRYNLDEPPPAARGDYDRPPVYPRYSPPPPSQYQRPRQQRPDYRESESSRDGMSDYNRPVQPRRSEPEPIEEDLPAPKKKVPAPKPETPKPESRTTVEDSPPPAPKKPEAEKPKSEPTPAPEKPKVETTESKVPEPPKESLMGSSTASTSPSTSNPSPAPAPTPAASGPPTGTKTDKPGRVKSPYPPFNELDVTGLSTGSLAMDPTTQKVFRVP